MPRPQKKRYVCCMPQYKSFSPDGFSRDQNIVLALDEYETIRLIDLEGYTQQECAEQMHVARTTVQSIYNAARRKLADAVVNGKQLVISGGDCILCENYRQQCGRGCKKHCHRHLCGENKNQERR